MNDFFQVLKRFVPPYKKYLFLNIFFNILAAFLTLFSFALIIPILEMLFMGDKGVVYHFMEWDSASLKDVAINNFYYAAYYCKTRFGASMTLMGLSVILVFMTGLKTQLALPDSYTRRYRARYPQLCLRQNRRTAYRIFHQRTQR